MVFPVVTIRHACAPPRLSLPKEQPGKLNFGWNGRRRRKSREETLRGSRRGERGEHRCRAKGEETKEDGGARRPFPRDSPI